MLLFFVIDFLLQINNELIKWEYYENLFKVDSQLPANLRIFYKLTEDHIAPSNMTKMRVFLAAQVYKLKSFK